MSKVVINDCYGGFSLSEKAVIRYAELSGLPLKSESGQWGPGYYLNGEYWSDRDLKRDDPHLVKVVEELGREAGGRFANLKIEEIPEGALYRIREYDGTEWVEFRDEIKWSVG